MIVFIATFLTATIFPNLHAAGNLVGWLIVSGCVVACVTAIVGAIRLARKGHTGYALFVLLTLIFGLLPATYCMIGITNVRV